MKGIKKISCFVLTLILCLSAFIATPATANAEGTGTSYYLRYDTTLSEWRVKNESWDSNTSHHPFSHLTLNVKDGDTVVIEDIGNIGLKLDLDVSLESLFVVNGNGIVVEANSIKNFYALNNSVSAITADVTNAYVYDACVCNFNKNVSNLEIANSKGDLVTATVVVVGTVDHVIASGKSYKHFEFYNFKENTFFVDNGTLKTDSANFSATPSATTPAPADPGDEYDEVPKTADIRFNPIWLLGIAVVCLAGSYKLKKEN